MSTHRRQETAIAFFAVMVYNHTEGDDCMDHKITDLIEPDNGCEGFAPGEEPMVTLYLDNGAVIKVPDKLA